MAELFKPQFDEELKNADVYQLLLLYTRAERSVLMQTSSFKRNKVNVAEVDRTVADYYDKILEWAEQAAKKDPLDQPWTNPAPIDFDPFSNDELYKSCRNQYQCRIAESFRNIKLNLRGGPSAEDSAGLIPYDIERIREAHDEGKDYIAELKKKNPILFFEDNPRKEESPE